MKNIPLFLRQLNKSTLAAWACEAFLVYLWFRQANILGYFFGCALVLVGLFILFFFMFMRASIELRGQPSRLIFGEVRKLAVDRILQELGDSAEQPWMIVMWSSVVVSFFRITTAKPSSSSKGWDMAETST